MHCPHACCAGTTLNVNAYATTYTYNAPAGFNRTQVVSTTDSGSAAMEIHILPELAPQVPSAASHLAHTVLEDMSVWVKCWALQTLDLPTTARITTLPAKGTLYSIPHGASTSTSIPVTTPGQALGSSSNFVRYVPNANAYGIPYDTFTYTVSIDSLSLTSSPATVTINVEADNDLPSVAQQAVLLTEDEHSEGVLVQLSRNDAEIDAQLDLLITALPTKGTLYQTNDGTLTGNRTRIASPYNIFDVGSVTAQYLDRVISVSSFWGGPPYAGYHPLTILGPPDCGAFGECPQDAPWVSDTSIFPSVGQRLLHASLVAFVTAIDVAGAALTIEYHTMYKPNANGDNQQCIIDPNGASKSYPLDCTHDLSNFNVNPETGRLRAVVPRSEIGAMDAGGWCPLQKGYVGTRQMSGGGAFGDQYAFNHVQDTYYKGGLDVPYTEYIEVAVASPVYPVQVEVGSPRGMGQVVSVRVKDPDGHWQQMYAGAALTAVASLHTRTRKYWQWVPSDSCRPHFVASEFRIEVDTSSETGIGDWNYIDYVKVYGASTLQLAALPPHLDTVVYVPDANAFGADSFQYRATDCAGDLVRLSPVGTVRIDIAPVNDAPVAHDSAFTMSIQERALVPLLFSDVDELSANLTVFILTLPSDATLIDVSGTSDTVIHMTPFEMAATGTSRISVETGSAVGNDTFVFRVVDRDGVQSEGTITLIVNAKQGDTQALITILVIFAVIIGIVALVVTWRVALFLRAAVRAHELHEAAKRIRCKKAVKAAITSQ